MDTNPKIDNTPEIMKKMDAILAWLKSLFPIIKLAIPKNTSQAKMSITKNNDGHSKENILLYGSMFTNYWLVSVIPIKWTVHVKRINENMKNFNSEENSSPIETRILLKNRKNKNEETIVVNSIIILTVGMM